VNWFYKNILRPILFTQDSEAIHDRTLRGLSWASHHASLRELAHTLFAPTALPVQTLGLNFPNPVGLAAGMDKQAAALPMWPSLGFGFSELGGVTRHPQPGNPSPRMFRAIAEEALINRMGFNNPGAETFARQLQSWRDQNLWPAHPVAINLGKSKITPLDKAPEDYAESFRQLRHLADFFVVNVSSPNTPNLRELQDKNALQDILTALHEINQSSDKGDQDAPSLKPILVKVAPDLSFEALDDVLELAQGTQLDGIVAGNTTITRPATKDPISARVFEETGGLSGRPLQQRSNEIVRHLYQQTKGSMPIIGVGGIFNAQDAWEKITSGATLVQIYTDLVYQGPGIVGDIVQGLLQRLNREGLNNLQEAVGIAATG
jgi:dihydroorotate dehydrogenase